MAKTITSPVERFPGTVELPDFLTVPQAITWERAQKEAQRLKDDPEASEAELLSAWVPSIQTIVAGWHLERFSVDPFQMTPRLSVIRLITWLIVEIGKLYEDEENLPNG